MPQIACAKLRALRDGAAIASKSCAVVFKVPVQDERKESKKLEVNV
jgi:hypothetical protein